MDDSSLGFPVRFGGHLKSICLVIFHNLIATRLFFSCHYLDANTQFGFPLVSKALQTDLIT